MNKEFGSAYILACKCLKIFPAEEASLQMSEKSMLMLGLAGRGEAGGVETSSSLVGCTTDGD